jgi:hypothetical protein
MAPHTLLIDRGEGHSAGVHIAWPRIKKVIAHQWELGTAEMAWLCFCPLEAVRISQVGPVHLAHGSEWAESRELESLRWKLLYPAPLAIRGKAIAVRPDHTRPGGWRALTEWEASNAEQVLRAYSEKLTPSTSDRWQGLLWRIHGQWARRFLLASPQEREKILAAFAQHEAAQERLRRQIAKPMAG